MGSETRIPRLWSQYSATELWQLDMQPPTLAIFYIYCTGGTEMLQSHKEHYMFIRVPLHRLSLTWLVFLLGLSAPFGVPNVAFRIAFGFTPNQWVFLFTHLVHLQEFIRSKWGSWSWIINCAYWPINVLELTPCVWSYRENLYCLTIHLLISPLNPELFSLETSFKFWLQNWTIVYFKP